MNVASADLKYLPGLKALLQKLVKDAVKQHILFPMCIPIPLANDGYTADGERAATGSLKKKLEAIEPDRLFGGEPGA
eukprot:9499926-Pyramimonas_sp.AAC.1